ncbi:MAG: MFS transporter [Phycisphaerales bacterium]|nr:MFS transporter [Phycisphaerales bacterium]
MSLAHLIDATIGRLHPRSIPLMARPSYRREVVAWSLLPIMLGAVEGGVVGTIATRAFVGVASESAIDLAVGIMMGAGASANLSSLGWAALARGRSKLKPLTLLQIATALCAAMPVVLPINLAGLVLLTAGVVLARVFWCGVITLRTSIWGANWPREVRAGITGRIMVVSSIMSALTGLSIGALLDQNPEAFRWLFPLVALIGLGGTVVYARVRIRRGAHLMEQEQRAAGGARLSLRDLTRPLAKNRLFRRYMICLFVLGSGNMMVDAPLVLALAVRFETDYLVSIAVVSSIPVITMPLVIGVWSKLLNRTHVLPFRAIHGWSFVASNAILLLGVSVASLPIVIVAAVMRGIGFAGGVLAWNLGHHDFAPSAESGTYMGTHVTLTGIRGLVAPLAGVFLWQWLGWWAFMVPLALSLAGALGFTRLARAWQSQQRCLEKRA